MRDAQDARPRFRGAAGCIRRVGLATPLDLMPGQAVEGTRSVGASTVIDTGFTCQKAGLNRASLDVAPRELRRRLTSEASWYGSGWPGDGLARSPVMNPSLLSQRDAAAVCGVSRSTIRRRRDAGRFPNAVRDGVLGWLIPEDDLRAAGLQLSRSAVPAGRIEADPAMGSDSRDVSVLERQLVEECHRCELAEAEVGRLRQLLGLQEQQLTVLRRALHVLTADPLSGSGPRGAGQVQGEGGVVRPRGEAGAGEGHG